MFNTLAKFLNTKSWWLSSSISVDDPADNSDHGAYPGIFINNFAAWSNSFDAGRAYRFYDNSRPLASTVDRISDAFTEILPSIFDRETNEWITAESDVAEAEPLRLMQDPGFGQTWRQFAGDLSVSYLLTRDAFFIMHGNIDRGPLAMAVAKPFYVDEEEAADGYVRNYRFSKTSGRMLQANFTRLKPTEFRFVQGKFLELYHILGKTRDDGLRGRSPISAVLWDLLQNVQGGQHNANMLKNGMRPSGALVASGDEELTDKQYTRLKEEMQDQYQSALNAGRPMLLDGGLKYESLILNNRDMDFAALMVMSADAISDRYKVPLAIVNKNAQTLDNYRTAIITLFDDAVEPLTKTIYDGIEAATFPRFGIDRNRFSLTANPKSINAAIIRQSEKMKQMSETNAFTQNEIRSEGGMEAIDGADTLYIDSNKLAVGEDPRVANPSAASVEALEDAEKSAFTRTLELGGLTKKAAEATADRFYGTQGKD